MPMGSVALLSCLLVAQSDAPKITERYDKFRDTLTTDLDLGEIPVAGPDRATIEVKFHRTTSGPERRQSSPQDHVALHFTASNDSWRYLKYHPIILLIDGKRVDMGDREHRGDVGSGYVLEQFFCPFTVAQAAELGRAGEVLIRVGRDEIALDLVHRTAILSWARRLQMERAEQDREWSAQQVAEAKEQARRKEADQAREAAAAEAQLIPRIAREYRAGLSSIESRSFRVAKDGRRKFRDREIGKLVADLARKYARTERQVMEYANAPVGESP